MAVGWDDWMVLKKAGHLADQTAAQMAAWTERKRVVCSAVSTDVRWAATMAEQKDLCLAAQWAFPTAVQTVSTSAACWAAWKDERWADDWAVQSGGTWDSRKAATRARGWAALRGNQRAV